MLAEGNDLYEKITERQEWKIEKDSIFFFIIVFLTDIY